MYGKFCYENLKGDVESRRQDTCRVNKEIVCDDVEWIQLAQDRIRCWDLVNMVMNLRVL
jgi:hypothetical protein